MKRKISNTVTSKNYVKKYYIAGVLITISLVIIYLLLTMFSKNVGTICLIRGIIGIPCPTCGLTRAILSFMSGDTRMAFYYHPLFWMPFVIGLIGIFKRKYIKAITIISITILIIVYLIRMVMYFPDVEPMKFNDKSVIAKLKI